jgi:hypothetical protein
MEPTAFEAAALHAAAVVHSGLPVTTAAWRSTRDENEKVALEDLERIATDLLGRWTLVVNEDLDLEPMTPAESMGSLAAAAREAEVALSETVDGGDDWDPDVVKYLVAVLQYADRLERYAVAT